LEESNTSEEEVKASTEEESETETKASTEEEPEQIASDDLTGLSEESTMK